MSNESERCEVCGGYKTIWYKVEIVTKDMLEQTKQVQGLLSPPATSPFTICHGHPEPMSNCPTCGGPLNANHLWCPGAHSEGHDGWLDRGKVCQVGYVQGDQSVTIVNHVEWEDDRIKLTFKQSLSLLAWLTQEKETLERLAKEQEG